MKFPAPSLPHCMPLSSLDFTLSPMPNNNLIPKKDLIMGCKKVEFKSPQRLSQSASIFALTATESVSQLVPWELSFILFKGYFPSITGTKILPLPISCTHCPKCVFWSISMSTKLWIHLCPASKMMCSMEQGLWPWGRDSSKHPGILVSQSDLFPSF